MDSKQKYKRIYKQFANKIINEMDPSDTYEPIKYYYDNTYHETFGNISFEDRNKPRIGIWVKKGGEPLVSYEEDIFVLLHEYGHYKNVISTKNTIKSVTGFEYTLECKKNRKKVLDEEYSAWKNAFSYLWNWNIQGINWLTRIYLCISFFFTAYTFYNSYKLYGKYDNS